jgi:hypothetical protein
MKSTCSAQQPRSIFRFQIIKFDDFDNFRFSVFVLYIFDSFASFCVLCVVGWIGRTQGQEPNYKPGA